MLDIIKYVTQDGQHFIGLLVFTYVFFTGLTGVIEAWRK